MLRWIEMRYYKGLIPRLAVQLRKKVNDGTWPTWDEAAVAMQNINEVAGLRLTQEQIDEVVYRARRQT